MDKINIYILDDHQIMIDGLKSLLSDDSQIQIVGHATDGIEALKEIPTKLIHVVISDIQMPGMNGLDFAKKMLAQNSEIKLMMLTVSSGDHDISELLKIGVSGYVLKNAGKEELRKAIIRLANGEKYFSSEVAEGLLRMKEGVTFGADLHFTPREIEVFQLIAREFPNKQIADELSISERTVESHRKNIFRKAGVKTVVGLIKFGIEHGYLN